MLKETLIHYFDKKADIVLAYLFGSEARNAAGPLSDIDVAVLLKQDIDPNAYFDYRLQITNDLVDLLQVNQVDVLILNRAAPAIRYTILRDGVYLFSHSEDERALFEAKTVTDYLDFLPTLLRHETALIARAKEGKLTSEQNGNRGTLERYRRRRQQLEGLADRHA